MYSLKRKIDEFLCANSYRLYSDIMRRSNSGMTELIVGRAYHSPLREDKNPSFEIFNGRGGVLLWHDFSSGETGNVLQLYARAKGVSVLNVFDHFNERSYRTTRMNMSNVIAEMQRLNKVRQRKQESQYKQVEMTVLEWSNNTYSYWSLFHVRQETLSNYKVKPIDKCSFIQDSAKFPHDPMYTWPVGEGVKIYRPYAPRITDKWRTTAHACDIQGWDRMDKNANHLIITKALKDVMVLREIGYNAIAPQSESTGLPEERVKELLNMNFPRIYVFYDNDAAGRKGADKLLAESPFWLPIRLTGKGLRSKRVYKDIAEFANHKGLDDCRKWMEKQMQRC